MCFQAVTDLKVNPTKSELIPVGERLFREGCREELSKLVLMEDISWR